MSPSDKVIVITGGTQGLGLHLAGDFLKLGSRVAICGRHVDTVNQAAQQLRNLSGDNSTVLALPLDISNGEQVSEFFAQVEKMLGPADVVISNAGIYGPIGPLVDNETSAWIDAISVNLIGSMNVMREAARSMTPRLEGRIIQLSGGGATKPMPNFTSYAASKAAVVRLVESLAWELSPYQIPVNAVAPGALNTRMLDQVLDSGVGAAGEDFYAQSIVQRETGGAGFEKASDLIRFLAFAAPKTVTGRLISAVWDDWQHLLVESKWTPTTTKWTLRRID